MASPDRGAGLRKELIAAAAEVWSVLGRDGQGLEARLYHTLRARMLAILDVRFPLQFTPDRAMQVVERCLHVYLIPLFIRHLRPDSIGPEDVPGLLDDVALAHIGSPSTPDPRMERWSVANDAMDDQLVDWIFGNEVDGEIYRRALTYLRINASGGGPISYLIVTEFVDQAELRGRYPKHAEVAEALAPLAPRYVVTEELVGVTMLRFAGILQRLQVY